MTKEEFWIKWRNPQYADHDLMKSDLYNLIESERLQSIAEHEQNAWNRGNVPEKAGDYLVQFPNGDIDLDHFNGLLWDMIGGYAIAFCELPAPYQEGGDNG